MWTPELSQELLDAAHGKLPPKKKDRPNTVRVFKNNFLENYLAKAHWSTPGIWFGPLIAYGLYRGFHTFSAGKTLGLFAIGWLVWSLSEYLLHRYLFHTLKYGPGREQNYLVHAYHHDFPDDPYRLVMVPLGSWPLGVVWSAAYYFILGPQYCWPVLAGTAVGYVLYDWIHFYTHHARPTWGPGKWMRRYHLQHHHGLEDTRYGVSSPLWDYIFGTYMPPKSAANDAAEASSGASH